MDRYYKDRSFSDQTLPLVANLLAPLLLRPADLNQDLSQATDLVCDGRHIAVRVRRFGCGKFVNEFTLRDYAPARYQTEFQKVMNGAADWLFVGHVDANCTDLVAHRLIDLHRFRAAWPAVRWTRQTNKDGTKFVAVDITSLPPGALISAGG